jgi:hypothetical protein
MSKERPFITGDRARGLRSNGRFSVACKEWPGKDNELVDFLGLLRFNAYQCSSLWVAAAVLIAVFATVHGRHGFSPERCLAFAWSLAGS